MRGQKWSWVWLVWGMAAAEVSGEAIPLPGGSPHEAASPAGETSVSPSDRLALGQSLARSGRHEEAIRELTLLLSLNLGHVDAQLVRGRVFAWAKRFDEAVADLQRVVEQSPRYADAWSALGDAYLWSGQSEEALEAYREWVKLDPEKPAPYAARGKAHQASRQFPSAREDYLTAMRLGGDAGLEQRITQLDQNPERSAWSVAVSGSPQWFFGARADWMNGNLSVKRQWEGVSAALGYTRISRYALVDEAAWTDVYANLWPRSYGNLLLQVSPDSRVSPRWDGALEVFQGVGSGWEAALRLRRMTFASSAVFLTTPAIAWYPGEWYLRVRLTHVASASLDLSWAFQARRYLGNADTYVEATAGLGVDEVASTISVGSTALAWSRSVAVKFQVPVLSQMDLGVSWGVQDETTLGYSMTVGLELRVRP